MQSDNQEALATVSSVIGQLNFEGEYFGSAVVDFTKALKHVLDHSEMDGDKKIERIDRLIDFLGNALDSADAKDIDLSKYSESDLYRFIEISPDKCRDRITDMVLRLMQVKK